MLTTATVWLMIFYSAHASAITGTQEFTTKERCETAAVQIAQAVAEIVERHASAKQKDAAAYKTTVEAQLAPQKAAEEADLKRQQMHHQAQMDRANFQQGAKDKQEDRKIAAKQKANA